MTTLQDFLPHYDFSEKHEALMVTSPEKAYAALQKIDFSESKLISLLFHLRGLKHIQFRDFQQFFLVLEENPPNQIILGLIACPWQLKPKILKLAKEEFLKFHEPGYIKAVWNFKFESVEQKTLVTTETKIFCLDRISKIKFGIYWFFIRPFSGIIRREILRLLQKYSKF